MRTVRLLAEAEAEVDAALAWYRRELPHRAGIFADAIDDALERVGKTPDAFAVTSTEARAPIRRAQLHGFPWGVFFVETATEIVVIAVAHARREPGYWARRLET